MIKNIFIKLLKTYPEPKLNLEKCISTLRSSLDQESIKTYQCYIDFLKKINHKFDLYITSCGNIIQHKYKLRVIKFPERSNLKQVFLEKEIELKPSPKSLFKLRNWQDFLNPIYIGYAKSEMVYFQNFNIEYLDVRELKS